MSQRTSILFLCTGNSARSIMAEALANGRFGATYTGFSAGSRPKRAPNPMALATLQRHGIATAGLRSKSWADLEARPFDLVVTLCGSAAGEPCPVFPGAPARAHWGFPDPPADPDPPAAFERVFAGLDHALAELASGEGGLAERATRVGEKVTRVFGGGA